MSSKHEIEEELAQAENRLANLCHSENEGDTMDDRTVVIHPTCGDQMQSLREECSQLRIILEAIEASED